MTEVTKFLPQGEIETPYMKAKKEWDSRIGSARQQAFHWRLAFFISAGLCIILTIGLISLSTKQHAIPYIIQVDKLGRVQNMGPVQQDNFTPSAAGIKYFLSQFIIKVRTITLDPVVLKQNWQAML